MNSGHPIREVDVGINPATRSCVRGLASVTQHPLPWTACGHDDPRPFYADCALQLWRVGDFYDYRVDGCEG